MGNICAEIQNRIMELADSEYSEFQAKLTPSVSPESIIGVRIPLLRKLSKVYAGREDIGDFLDDLPHRYYDENLLHGLIISECKDYDKTISYLDRFLPYVDNWAVCDTMSPKAFKKNRDKLICDIKRWIASDLVYTIRFGEKMLMSHFLDEDFIPGYLDLAASVRSSEYYVNMMTSWCFATALAKQWDSTVPYIEDHKLDTWVHNKTIQKAVESYRITDEQKKYLRTLRIRTEK